MSEVLKMMALSHCVTPCNLMPKTMCRDHIIAKNPKYSHSQGVTQGSIEAGASSIKAGAFGISNPEALALRNWSFQLR